MMRLGAPYPGLEVYTYLPDPEFADTENSVGSVEFKRSMTNTRYSYVKSRAQHRRLSFSIIMTRMKALELRAFLLKYPANRIELLDHLGVRWLGYITTNPNEFETTGANRSTANVGHAMSRITLEFRGVKQ
jgi:hypothetical protein